MKLNKNAKKWVKALESGEFKQTTRKLADKDGYCCLGVLCEIAIANGLEVNKKVLKNGTIRYDKEAAMTPESVMNWVGLRSSDGSFNSQVEIGDTIFNDLADLNDEGVSFKKIAKIIRERAEEIFNV